jgi:hypothetical protein
VAPEAHALRLKKRNQAEQFIHLRFERRAIEAAQASGELQVFAAREMRIEMRLFGHVADAVLELLEILADIAPVKKDAPGIRLDEADDHLDGGAFAGSVGAQVAENLSGATGDRRNVPHCGADC